MTSPCFQLLLVDDDSNVIASINRVLRTRVKNWQIHSAKSGREALEVARHTALDAIITDMRMPEMDGATLLARIFEIHPNCVRMVLSGQSEREYSIAAAQYAHRFLAKPCRTEELSEHIRATLEARAQLNAMGGADLVGLGHVLLDSDTHSELQAILAAESYTPEAFSRRLTGHTGMVLKLLQLVSSAFFTNVRATVLSKEAINTLGAKVLRNLFQSGLFRVAADHQRLALEHWQRRARRCAALASHIASECQLPQKERELLTCAAQLVSVNRHIRAQEHTKREGGDVWGGAVRDAQESAALSQLWGLPEALAKTLREFATVADDTQGTLHGSVLALAILLAHKSLDEIDADAKLPTLALEKVSQIKPIETWVRSIPDWFSEEASG